MRGPSFRELLAEQTVSFIALSDGQMHALEAHYVLLAKWNRQMNLTAIRTLEESVNRHYAECLFLASVLAEREEFSRAGSRIVDIGSGGGFPGIPVAIALPEVQMELVEANQKKCVFLREASRALANVTVRASRIEANPESYDVQMVRAVALEDIEPVTRGLAPRFAALLGDSDAGRIQESSAYTLIEKRPLPWGERRVVVLAAVDVPRGTSPRV